MARADARCTCKECGEQFIKVKYCHNRKEADEFEEWAKDNITLCPECWAKKNRASQNDKLRAIEEECGVVFPELTAVSDKQLNFALAKRAEYVVNRAGEERIKALLEFMDNAEANREQIEEKCAEKGKIYEEAFQAALKARGYDKLYCALTETNAGKLLDKILIK